jgi:hypothetical protein
MKYAYVQKHRLTAALPSHNSKTQSVNVGEQYEAPNTSLMMDTNDSGGV